MLKLKKIINALKIDSENYGKFEFRELMKNQVDILKEVFPGKFAYKEDRGDFEYIYSINDLADLKGKKYHSKRNHISKYNKVWAQKFADGLMRSEYRQQIVEDWKNRRYKIKGFILGYLKQAGVIDPKLTNRDIARAADIMDNPNTFGEYMGIESRKQPYAEWILNHIDDYC